MKSFFSIFFGTLWFFAMLLAVGFYLWAATNGAQVWFGWEGPWVPVIFAIAFVMVGGFGAAVVLVIGGYGALYAWSWPWYYVVPVFFPGIPIMAISLMGGLVATISEKISSIYRGPKNNE